MEEAGGDGPKQQTLADSGSAVDLNRGLMGFFFLSARLLNCVEATNLSSAVHTLKHFLKKPLE